MLPKHTIAVSSLTLMLSIAVASCGSDTSETAGALISGRGKSNSPGGKGTGAPQQPISSQAPIGGPGMGEVALRVLSYNTYHLPADRASLATSEQRLRYLPDALARTGSDIIILQEVWTPTAQQALREKMIARGYNLYQLERRSALPPFFLGNGLMVFARQSIAPAGKLEFLPWKETAGFDKYAQKGALRVPLIVPGVGRVDVYNAHTSFLPWDSATKNYDYEEADVLFSQVNQLAEWVRKSDASLKILGADANTSPFVWDPSRGGFDTSRINVFYGKLREVFEDPFAKTTPQCRYTCDTWDNKNNDLLAEGIFGSDNPLGGLYDPEPNAKLDYVMFSGAGARVAQTGTAMYDEFPMVYNLKSFNSPLSDHFAIYTDLRIPTRP